MENYKKAALSFAICIVFKIFRFNFLIILRPKADQKKGLNSYVVGEASDCPA